MITIFQRNSALRAQLAKQLPASHPSVRRQDYIFFQNRGSMRSGNMAIGIQF